MAVLTTALARLRADFNTRFPARDKASDGWIGNAAHQKEASGHNPDDTAGSRSEYTDTDSAAEVRALDVDTDFHEPGVTAQMVVDNMLRTPADLTRLRYMIYNQRIWSRNTNWQPREYTGASAHTEHIHFSGDPSQDDNGAPWLGVLTAGDDMSAADVQQIKDHIDAQLRRLVQTVTKGVLNPLTDPKVNPWVNDADTTTLNEVAAMLRTMGAQVAAQGQRDFVDEQAIVAGVVQGLGAEQIADAVVARIQAAGASLTVDTVRQAVQDELAEAATKQAAALGGA